MSMVPHDSSQRSHKVGRYRHNPIVIAPPSKNRSKNIGHVVLVYNEDYSQILNVHRIVPLSSEYINEWVNAVPESDEEYSFDYESSRRVEREHAFDEITKNKENGCETMMEWQKRQYASTNCNTIHEITQVHLKYIQKGSFRAVFQLLPPNEDGVVLKALNSKHDFNYREFDRHRRDALTMSQLQPFPSIPSIYGYCTNSALYDYSPHGNLDNYLYKHKTTIKKEDQLKIAYQVAKAVADVHSIVNEYNHTAVSHTDVTSDQFLYSASRQMFQLNDFNRVRFVPWNPTKKEPCAFEISKSPGKFRSPEEYEYIGLTKQIDIYQMSSVFYVIWTLQEEWEDVSVRRAQIKIRNGERPPIPPNLLNSTHPIDVIFRRLLKMTQRYDPNKRATASEIETYLKKQLHKLQISSINILF